MFTAPMPDLALSGTLGTISAGAAGTRQTLRAMRRMVNQYRTDLGLLTKAREVIFLTPAKDECAEANAVFEFVRDHIRYTKDINGVETLSAPDKTLAYRVGDCDDKTTLLATLLECVGYPTRFVVAGYGGHPNEFEHVYLQVLVNDEWFDADATEPHQLGWMPPNPTSLMIEKV